VFNATVGKEDIFILRILNESLLKISNDNGVRGVNITYLEISVKSTMCPT
jgi:hypothetical protein